MLRSLRIRNFQRIKNLKIKLDPYVTTIVGENDRGKSAVLRAIRWLCSNRPSGKGFVRTGSNRTTVELQLEGHRIVRSTGASHNEYSLDGEKFKSFRSEVPAPIRDLLSVQDINFQHQLEPAFWFTLTPGQVTKELNKLVDLEAIDKFQTILARRQKKVRDRLLIVSHGIELERLQVRSLAWVESVNVKMGKLSTAIGGLGRTAHQRAAVGRLLSDGSKQAQRGADAAAGRLWLGAGERFNRLAGLLGRLGGLQAGLSDPPQPPAEYSGDRLEELIVQAEDLNCEIADTNAEYDKAKASMEEALGGRCPICGGFLSDESLI